MWQPSFTDRRFRLAFYAAILLLPAWTLWNMAALQWQPSLAFRVGPRLDGVTQTLPLEWNWQAIKSGNFQRAITNRVAAGFPFQRILVRINNEIRATLFGEVTAPGVVRGRGGQLVEDFYVNAYCGITPDLAERRARETIPMLRDLADYYRARGATFLYVVTPSKVAAMPEAFVGGETCAAPREIRSRLVADYVALLRQSGIPVVDTANLIYKHGGPQGTDMYPMGGAHWNALGAAYAAREVEQAINRAAGRALLPPFEFSYAMSADSGIADRDLTGVLNVLFPPLGYPTPEVTYRQPVACETSAASTLEAAIVGSSYMHSLGSILIEQACLSRLNVYFYLYQGRFGGVPYGVLQPADLTESDYAPLRDVRIMILEDNEGFLNRPNPYVEDLHAFITGRPKIKRN